MTRILVSGGGTGGHVYPILTVVDALRTCLRAPSAVESSSQIRYAGTPDGVEAQLVAQSGLDFVPIQAGQLRIYNPAKLIRNVIRMGRGARQALALMRDWQPQVLFVTGGYVCAPVAWAAARYHVPTMIYLPDLEPGLAVQRLARYAQRIAVTFPETAKHFPAKDVIVTGYPVRVHLRQRSMTKEDARREMGLAPELPTLLIFGGSHGARSINVALAGALTDLLPFTQIIHITGEYDWQSAQTRVTRLPPEYRDRYQAYPYLHDRMVQALHAADLAVTRAGASTLGEFPAIGLPAILVPLPISGGHQYANARYLSERHAALIVRDEELADKLVPLVTQLVKDADALAKMSAASTALAQPHAAEHLAEAILELSL